MGAILPMADLAGILRRRIAPPPSQINTGGLALAAVLVPIVQAHQQSSVVLTRRADHLRDHPGQISFPGGLFAAQDESPQATALREAEEEIALERTLVEVIGALPALTTHSGFYVVPHVGWVNTPFEHLPLKPSPAEVAEIFHLPLATLSDPTVFCEMDYQGCRRWVYRWHGRVIWGVTANILQSLARTLILP